MSLRLPALLWTERAPVPTRFGEAGGPLPRLVELTFDETGTWVLWELLLERPENRINRDELKPTWYLTVVGPLPSSARALVDRALAAGIEVEVLGGTDRSPDAS